MIQKLSSETLRRHKGVSFVGVTTPFVCYDDKGRVFLAKRSKNARDEHGRWDFGSGGLKHGQSAEKNMRRELMEEYGVEPLAVTPLGYFELFRTLPDGTPTHWVAIAHAVKVDAEKVKIMEPDMFDDSGWFTLDALPSPLHSSIEAVLLPTFGEKLRNILTE
jgi:8-oxo-dGTP pyrophosphatase MutT (NUDIX family)